MFFTVDSQNFRRTLFEINIYIRMYEAMFSKDILNFDKP